MKRFFCASAVLGLLLMSADFVHAGALGYTLDITASYEAGGSGDAGPTGNPDTSVATFTNNGTTTFTGNIILDGTSPNQGHLTTTLAVTLAPGQSKSLTLSDEASNQGGWNGTGAASGLGNLGPDNGIQASFVGTINGTEAVNLSVFDKDIHSGVPRTNPFGITLDNFILQGGDANGDDTGDPYEETQAAGTFEFLELPSGVTPEPASLTLLAFGVVGMVGYGWRKRNTAG